MAICRECVPNAINPGPCGACLLKKIRAANSDKDAAKLIDDVIVDELVRQMRGGEEAAEAYVDELYRCQEALDMRCVDNPNRVGCADLLFSVADEIKKRFGVAEDESCES